MKIVTDIHEWQTIRKQILNKTIGFVPTMGNLHAGHLSLCDHSQSQNDITVVSIFVNPTQFNQPQDFDLYPRTLDEDIARLSSKNIDVLLTPTAEALYHDHYQFQMVETDLSLELEGAYRPGHFTGMLTVVLKFLNLVQPARAYFGEKDYQQLLLVKKMVEALFLPIEIVAGKIIRAEDGLALSSRNSRLNTLARGKAAHFPQLLQSQKTAAEISETLKKLDFKVDYIAEKWQRRLGAVWLDEVRLIDNFML